MKRIIAIVLLSICATTARAATSPQYNILSFAGVDPTGARDSTIGIQNGLNAVRNRGGGWVLFPGLLRITNAIYVRPTVLLQGMGAGRQPDWSLTNLYTVNRVVNEGIGTSAFVFSVEASNTNPTNKPSHGAIVDMFIQGNPLSKHGIELGDPGDGHPAGDYTYSGGQETSVERNIIIQHGMDGIHISGAFGCKINGNYIGMSGRYGLSTWVDANGISIVQNHIQGNAFYGIWGQGLWGSEIDGNIIEGNCIVNNQRAEMLIKQCYGLSIDGNYFEGPDPPVGQNFGITVNVDNHAVSIENNFFNTGKTIGTAAAIDISDDGSTGNHDFTIRNNTMNQAGYMVVFRPEAFDLGGASQFTMFANYTRDNATSGTDMYANFQQSVYYDVKDNFGGRSNMPKQAARYTVTGTNDAQVVWSVGTNAMTASLYDNLAVIQAAAPLRIGTAFDEQLALYHWGTNRLFLGVPNFETLISGDSRVQFGLATNGVVRSNFGWDSGRGYWTSGGNLDSSIYLANQGVGINTTTPAANTLDVNGDLRVSGDAVVAGSLDALTLNLGTLNTGTLTTTNGVIFRTAADGPAAATIGAGNAALWLSNSIYLYLRTTADGISATDTLVSP